MSEIMFGERVLNRDLVPDSGSLPTDVSELTIQIAREAGLQIVLRSMESPEGPEAGAFVENLWSGAK